MATRGDPLHELIDAVRAVRAAAADLSFPLPMPSASAARTERSALLAQVDDYLLPRLSRLDAPLLVAVGGGTGAGKSTLVNSLVRAPVSPAGVLRPTTRTPVLVCHPADTAWFRGGGPLRSLPRVGTGADPALQQISAQALRAGVAFLDIPDFDAVVDTNRAIANQLLAAADLWLFVTTAARYADHVPWEMLRAARQRGTAVALVLNRVPHHGGVDATGELVTHMNELLAGNGLAGSPLFALPAVRTDGQGLLPDSVLAPLRNWFNGLCNDPRYRAMVARHTLNGALMALGGTVDTLATAAEEQITAAEVLAEGVGIAYGGARATIERGLRERPIPEPEESAVPVARPSGPRHGAAAARSRRDWAAAQPGPQPGGRRGVWEAGLVTLVSSAAADAAERAQQAWLEHPAGQAMIMPGLATASEGLAVRTRRLARAFSGVDGQDLVHRVGELLDSEAARWLDGLAGVPPDYETSQRLRDAAAAVESARPAALEPPPSAGTAGSTPGRAAGTADPAGGTPPSRGPEPDRVGR